MKYVWEESDIEAGRRVWSRSNSSNGEYIISYSHGDGKSYHLTRLDDGGCASALGLSKEELAENMNQSGMRPITVMEPFKLITGEDLDARGAPHAKRRDKADRMAR